MASDDLHTIAERYARAFFALADDAGALEAVEKDFFALKEAIHTVPELPRLFTNPILPRALKAKTLEAVLKKLKAHALTLGFVQRLALAQRLAALPAIIAEFEKDMAARRGETVLEVITAQPMSDTLEKTVTASLAKAYGHKVQVKPSVDASLIGGLIVKAGGSMMDYSVKNKLARLERALKTQTV